MYRHIKKTLLLIMLFFCFASARSQELGIKTNFIYGGATLTPNIAAELGFGKSSSLQLLYGLNLWKGEHQRKHWMLQPEYRFWLCQPLSGWFLGIYARGGEFNVSDSDGLFGMPKAFKRGMREEGWFAGGGLTFGYQWMLSTHWSLELSAGAGYSYLEYTRYQCGECGERDGQGHDHYTGPTNAALSLIYVF